MSLILAIGDSHDEPGKSQARFRWLGNLIKDRKPTHIVQMGDFLTLDSLSDYDKNKKLIVEGRRLKKEVDSGKSAYEQIMYHLRSSKYKPKKYWLTGNHEERASRYVQEHSEMAGFIPYPDLLGVEKDNWEVVNYKDYIYIDGIGFTHIPMNAINKPIGGKYVGQKALEMHNHPIVFGHTHRLLVDSGSVRTAKGMECRRSVNVGCYFDYIPDYAKGSSGTGDWWGGVVLLHTHRDKTFDVETISIKEVRRRYG